MCLSLDFSNGKKPNTASFSGGNAVMLSAIRLRVILPLSADFGWEAKSKRKLRRLKGQGSDG